MLALILGSASLACVVATIIAAATDRVGWAWIFAGVALALGLSTFLV